MKNFLRNHGIWVLFAGAVVAAALALMSFFSASSSPLANLTGIIASLLAQGASPVRAAAGGVWLHGRAGDLAARRLTAYAMTPEDVTAALGEAFQELEA